MGSITGQHKTKVLVTGATGLVGSHLVQLLVQSGYPVRALYRSAIPAYAYAEQVEWVQGDILDIIALEHAMEGIQQVYHCAAIVSYQPGDKQLLNETNVQGTVNVVNACLEKGVRKLVYVSSVAALGRLRDNQMVNETMKWSPETSNSEYGKSKYRSEMEVWRGIGEGLEAVIVNPSIILGASDWSKGSAAVFKNAYDEFPWYTDGLTGFVDVADVVKAMMMLMESNISGERYILSAENVPYKDLFTMIAGEFNRRPPHRKVTPFIAALVWRMEAVKSFFSGRQSMLTKETATIAQMKVYFDNSRLQQALPAFRYTPIMETIRRICGEYRNMYKLPG